MKLADRSLALPPSAKEERTKLYFAQLLPLFNSIKAKADDVLNLNLKNMEDENRRAREAAAVSVRLMYGALAGGAAVATIIALRPADADRAPPSAWERVVAGLSGRSPDAPALLRKATRLADRLNVPWYAVYIQTPAEDFTKADAVTRRVLAKNLELPE